MSSETYIINMKIKSDKTESDETYYQVWWHILRIRALHLTHPKCTHTDSCEHTHTVNTHPEQWAAIYAAAPGEQLGVRCLAQGHLSRGIEGGESAVHSTPHLQFLPAQDSNSQPLDYESSSLTIGHNFPIIQIIQIQVHLKKVKPIYYIDSEWNISSLYFFTFW